MNPISRHGGKLRKTLVAIACAGAFVAPQAYAQTVTIDFSALSAPNPPGTLGTAPVADYLAGYGVSTTNQLWLVDTSVHNWIASPTTNVISGGDASGTVYTLTFSFASAVDNFSFVRAGAWAAYNPSGSTRGDWTATAFDASNNFLASVGEGPVATYSDIAWQTFSLGTSGIDHVTFTGNHHGFYGTANPMITSLSFTTPVPEPETYAMLLAGLGLLGVAGRRRKMKEVATS